MPKKGYTVGQVSKITGVSKDTLRFYDKIDLLKPKYVDPENYYRYYTYDQFWSIDIINCCRSLDISLEKIRTILHTNDNRQVLALLFEQREEAVRKWEYFRRIVEDVDWYSAQQKRMEETIAADEIVVKHLPARVVLYGNNQEETQAYHLKLQELVSQVTESSHSIRRNYGFLLDETGLAENKFLKKGEYIRFDEPAFDMQNINPDYLTVLPEGDYACCVVEVVNETADFSTLLAWLEKQGILPEYVLADEVGLQLFEYLDCGYLCEVKVKLK